MRKVECANPLATDLKKGSGKRRHINAGDLKKIDKIDGKYCAWCGEHRVRGNRKYCGEYCRDNCYAFIAPQKEHGLEYHLQTQDFKCADCEFDYKPLMDEMAEGYARRNLTSFQPDGRANPWFFSVLKGRIEQAYGRGKRLEVDHIVPIALGGDVVGFDNHQVLCHDCHKCKTKIDVSAIAKMKRKKKEPFLSLEDVQKALKEMDDDL